MLFRSGVLWNDVGSLSLDPQGNLRSDHVVTLLSAVRDKKSGEVVGFYICDSGSGKNEKMTYVSAETMKKAFIGVTNACVQMTKKSYTEAAI